ncbi:MAG: hypothetical protein LBP98_00600, partial [Tannerella sp.]|nr:hypothetical protein [Tannerella sp.]
FLYFGNRGSEGFFLFAYTKIQSLPLIANPLQQHTFYITTNNSSRPYFFSQPCTVEAPLIP